MSPRTSIGSIVRLVLTVAVALSVLSGCGGSSAKKAAKADSKSGVAKWRAKDCQAAGSHGSASYLLCWRPTKNEHGAFLRVVGGEKTTLPLAPPGATPTSKYAGRDGHWYWAALSPDGSRFLAQWSGDCEIPTAFFVSLGGGKPTPVTGESDWLKSPNTMAYGWTTNGRAIVFIPTKPACGTGVFRPGIYLVGENCPRELIWPGKEPPARLERSLKPRTVGRLRAILGANAS
ncbi:MAG: hypothetical protein ABSC36_00850 [Gaiellaceae bacterium]|jgi:hypothetical protein